MRHYTASRLLPYSAAQLFDLVADVESYPAFLPGWRRAGVVVRQGDRIEAEQVVGLGPLHWRFRTAATLRRHRCLRITSTDRPFRRLEITWRFEPEPDGCCLVSCRAAYDFRSTAIAALIGGAFEDGIRRTLGAFVGRARQLYGPAAAPGRAA